MWDGNVIFSIISLWYKETWISWLPPVNIFNDESVRSPWFYQLDVYTSTNLDVVAVAIYSEELDSCDILGVLAQDVTLLVSGEEQHQR